MALAPGQFRKASGYGLVPATSAANVVIFAAPTTLLGLLVTSTGTGSGTFVKVFDNATTNSGNNVFTIPSNAAAGTVYYFECPLANGIVVQQVLNGPAITVVYS